MRGVAAAVAGIVGAASAHALDEAGLLPGVHESAAVREAMGPVLTLGWLGLAGLLAWLAARTKPALVGGAAALAVSAVPELVGRHDPGAIAEPGALAGALVQWLLLLAVLAVLLVIDRSLAVRRPTTLLDGPHQPAAVAFHRDITRLVDRRARPRAPPTALRTAAKS
jgi:hypothetical protein